jgi:hypothetical protein
MQSLIVVNQSALHVGPYSLLDVGNVRHYWAYAGLFNGLVSSGPHPPRQERLTIRDLGDHARVAGLGGWAEAMTA